LLSELRGAKLLRAVQALPENPMQDMNILAVLVAAAASFLPGELWH